MRSIRSHFPNLQIAYGQRFCPCRKRVSFGGRFDKFDAFLFNHRFHRQSQDLKISKRGYNLRNNVVCPMSMDQDSLNISPWDDWGNNEGPSEYVILSSDGEDSDGEILVTPINDVDMPNINKEFVNAEDNLMATAYRLAMLKMRDKKHWITYGFVTNLGLITFLMLLLAFLDWRAWRIVRIPLDKFYFLFPFLASAFLAACAGYVSVPILKRFNVRRKFKRTWPIRLFFQKGSPTVGGLFFVPIGVAIAKLMSVSSAEVSGTISVTLAFATVGLLDDTLGLIKYHGSGLSRRTRILLEVAVAAWFSFWLCTKSISSPYGMKLLVPLPAPFGLVNLGKCYVLLTSFTFIFMANGHNLIDGLDGLVGGLSALAFVGMSIAVLPISSELAVFGVSMSGACVGFLLHNRYKASVYMGNTGSLALAGALAAMASCSGMFFPLFIASGIVVLEVLAMIAQVLISKVTEWLHKRRLFPVAPLHYHLELFGFQEPFITAGAFVISSFLALLAGYVGLISA